MVLSKKYRDDGKPAIKLTKKQLLTRDTVLKKMSAGYYIQKNYGCLCGNQDNSAMEVLAEKDRYGLPVQTCICKKCGLIMTNPMFDQTSLNRFYDEDYRNLYVASEGPSDAFFKDQYEHGNRIVEFLKKHFDLNASHKVLEIGTGAGGILKAVNEKTGAQTCGIDLGREYINYGKEFGLDLYVENAEKHLQRNIKYNVIILSHVLEHFLDIEKEMTTIKKLLDEDGIIYVELPGVKNTFKTYGSFVKSLQNAHVRYFTLDTLKESLRRFGFECVIGNEFISSIFKVGVRPENEKMITNYYEDTINFLRRNERRFIWYEYVRPRLAKLKNHFKK
ncbi:MAG: methyltransferase domain-containing protein [Acetatifactor sp.]|nr:methyltransferase domain-containing protein [Acetatifactor sp.]